MSDQKGASSGKNSPLVLFGGGFLVASALWLGLNALRHESPPPAPAVNPPTAAVSSVPPAADLVADQASLAKMIAEDTARLGVEPHKVQLTTEKAAAVRDAVRRGDYTTADRIGAEVLAHSTLQPWSYYPLNLFVGAFTHGTDPVLLDHLNHWVEHEPKAALPLLLRGEYYLEAGWAARGEGFSSTISNQDMRTYGEDLEKAIGDVRKSIGNDGNIPFSYYEQLRIAAGYGNGPIAERLFQEGISKFPSYYPLYQWRLSSLSPKWGGSVSAMVDFVNQYAGMTPGQSPLRLLYLQLHSDLLNASWVDCNSVRSQTIDQCVIAEMNRLAPPELEGNVTTALNLYRTSDHLQFNVAAEPIFTEIAEAAGSAPTAGAILQRAAVSMDSETNMIEDHPGRNNYLADLFAGDVWAHSRYYDNAEHKYQEALSDIKHFDFAGEEEKDLATADIYEHLMWLADNTSQYEKVVVYRNAVEALGGTAFGDAPFIKCRAYFHLKHYVEAIQECTRQIEGDGDTLPTHYWRARAYDLSNQLDAAMKDYLLVAGSESEYRASSAIDISVIYGKKGDPAGQLVSMNSYPYLFDRENQEQETLSVAYNNRCYAEMKVGQLQKALDDCNISLKYGNIPDAIQKRAALEQQLAAGNK
jgi:hypothetical protein